MARDETIVLLLIATATVTTCLRVSAPGSVTVRRGEQLQLSCDITLEAYDNIKTARWDKMQGSGYIIFGAVDVSGGCGFENRPCIGNTTDNRGTVLYERGMFNNVKLTLTINKSVLEDNTKFQCVVINETRTHAAIIMVTINYFPNATYPMCFVSSYIPGPPILPSILSCSSEFARPTVSILWTTSVSSTVLAGSSGVVGDQIENNLHLDPSWNYTTYFCQISSDAFPGIERNCSVDIRPPIISTDSSSVSAPHDPPTTPDSSTPTLHFTDPSPTNSNPSSFSPVIIAVLSAVGSVIIILLAIIICLVSSRRKARRCEDRETNLPLSTPVMHGGEASRQVANIYGDQNYYQPTDLGPGGGNTRDAGPTDRAPRPPPEPMAEDCRGAYAVTMVVSGQPPPPPVYAVLDPDAPSDDTPGDYSYATVQKRTAPPQDGQRKTNVPDKRSTTGASAVVGQIQPGGSSGQPGDDIGNGGGYTDDDSDTIFVDNILYVASSDDALQPNARYSDVI